MNVHAVCVVRDQKEKEKTGGRHCANDSLLLIQSDWLLIEDFFETALFDLLAQTASRIIYQRHYL